MLSQSVQTCANRALKVFLVALALAEYVLMAITWSPVSKKFRRLCANVKIREETREEIGYAAESEINVAVRKTFD
jgi:hypothetical protein